MEMPITEEVLIKVIQIGILLLLLLVAHHSGPVIHNMLGPVMVTITEEVLIKVIQIGKVKVYFNF